jgi:MFS family permease
VSEADVRQLPPPPAADQKPPGGQPSDGLNPRRWWALPVALTATFLSLFDLFVVNVAAPSVERELHTNAAAIQLIIAGYSFTYAIGLITAGRLGDIFGPRAMFLTGMAVFTAASFVCGIAPTALVLILARLAQGLGASIMVPQVLALIQVLFPLPERPRAFAFFGATAGLGSIAGQVLGGVLLVANLFDLSWRPVFLIQLPIGLASIIAGAVLLPRPAAKAAGAPARIGSRIDPAGTVLFTVALGAVLLPLIVGRESDWPLWSIVCLIASVPLFVLFAVQQRARVGGGAVPLIAPGLFRDRAFTLGLLINLAFYANLASFFLVVTLFLQNGLGMSALRAGLTFGWLGVGFVIGSFFLARRLAAKYGQRLLVLGVALVVVTLAAGIALVAVKGTDINTFEFAPVMFFVGLGNGLVLPTVLNVVLAGVSKELAGSASGVLVTMQQVGSALGIAAVGSLFFARLGDGGAYRSATVAGLVADGLLVVLVWVLIGVLTRTRAQKT